MKLTKREAAYLSRKRSGGDTNQQGNTYEKYFAVNEIATHTNKYLAQLRDVFISTQVNAFVDDLYILNQITPEKTYYQLKSGKKLSWGSVRELKPWLSTLTNSGILKPHLPLHFRFS